VQLLIEKRANPNAKSENGTYPLATAVKERNFELVKMLLKAEADVNLAAVLKEEPSANTVEPAEGAKEQPVRRLAPLHHAAFFGDGRVVAALLRAEANPNATDNTAQTPLFYAADGDTCTTLLEANADCLHLNSRGQNAIHWASLNGVPSTIRVLGREATELLEAEDDLGRRPLHLAAWKGHHGAVQCLLDIGVYPKALSSKGNSAMSLAYNNDHQALAYYLYIRITGGRYATWSEFFQNPMLLIMGSILGVSCFVNRQLIYDVYLDFRGY
jgi:ankyrin repeat protein